MRWARLVCIFLTDKLCVRATLQALQQLRAAMGHDAWQRQRAQLPKDVRPDGVQPHGLH